MYRNVKRALDTIGALALIIILTPLFLTLIVFGFVYQGRPVFFIQVRPGLHGRPFRMVKFRTMTSNSNSNSGPNHAPTPTAYGRLLRKTSLDELPQLLNVFLGDMSFVGPRPLLSEYLERYSTFQRRRHNVRPGITGLAQIRGRNHTTWQRRLALDVAYVERMSWKLDLWVVSRTLVEVVRGTGTNHSKELAMPIFEGSSTEHQHNASKQSEPQPQKSA
jgi:lipopolysaccharide/colanic/teichoic acid biosynthesis glycosyltransferase